jgi:hypothetical protein
METPKGPYQMLTPSPLSLRESADYRPRRSRPALASPAAADPRTPELRVTVR